MEMKIIFAGAIFLGGWLWFYLFLRQLLFNLCTAFPLIKAMNTAQPELIAVGAKRYTIVSLCSCLVVVETYPVFDALCVNCFYPGIITDPSSGTGFSAHGYTLDDRASVR